MKWLKWLYLIPEIIEILKQLVELVQQNTTHSVDKQDLEVMKQKLKRHGK